MKKFVTYILATAALAAALASCQKKEVIVGTQDKEGFFLNRTSIILSKGTTGTLTATVTPKGAGTVSWSSSDERIATIADGVITAVGGGEAVISAKYGTKTLDCTVFVNSDVTTVTLSDHNVDFDKGDTKQLSVEYGPDDVNVPVQIEWVSSDESVLTVDENGLVTAVGGGQASIAVNVNGVTDVCEFFSHCYPTGVEITPASAEVNVNKTLQFTARLLPDDVTEELDFEWSVADPTLADIDENGLLTALAAGNTKVIVQAGEFSAEATLTVKREIKTVSIKPNTVNFVSGDITFAFGSGCYFYGARWGMEVVAGSNFKVSVPAGYQIDKIVFTPTYNGNRGDFTVNTGTYSRTGGTHTWTASESVESVTFTNGNGFEFDILEFTITYQ